MFLLKFVDQFLNSYTMYRLVLYALAILAGISIIFGFAGLLPFSGFQVTYTLSLILVSSFLFQTFFAGLLKVVANVESWLVTALIIFLVIAPIANIQDIFITLTVCFGAVAAKFVFAPFKKHIFNPVAITLFLLGFFGFGNGIWWIGSSILIIPVTIVGLLIVRKIRRFSMLSVFLVAASLTTIIFNFRYGLTIFESISQLFVSWPIIFFGTVMFTEPLTTPKNRPLQLMYGAIVGMLFGAQFSFGPLHSSPELALIIGNVFSYLTGLKRKLELTLQERVEIAHNTYEFVFIPNFKPTFSAGQYLEWTLGHNQPDNRGNRRYFTIASSPTETNLKLGIKFNDRPSSFKTSLLNMKSGDKIFAGQLAGDFVLPGTPEPGLVFIAGGIGITPFRSMVQYLSDTKQKVPITLLYANNHEADIAYKQFLTTAEKTVGLKTVYVLTDKEHIPAKWQGEVGYITAEMVKKYVSNYAKNKYYLSGPSAMVDNYKKMLADLGISPHRIVTDYFPGF